MSASEHPLSCTSIRIEATYTGTHLAISNTRRSMRASPSREPRIDPRNACVHNGSALVATTQSTQQRTPTQTHHVSTHRIAATTARAHHARHAVSKKRARILLHRTHEEQCVRIDLPRREHDDRRPRIDPRRRTRSGPLRSDRDDAIHATMCTDATRTTAQRIASKQQALASRYIEHTTRHACASTSREECATISHGTSTTR